MASDGGASARADDTRYRIVAETASDAILTMGEDGTILSANPAVERIFGWRPDEVCGRSLSILMPPRMRAAHDAGVRRYLATGRRNISWHGVPLPGLHRDGHEVPLEVSFGEYHEDGRTVFAGIVRDVSDRVAQQRALEETAAELEETNDKLAETVAELRRRTDEAEAANRAKSDFLAVMSHELRTPLNAVLGYTDLMAAGITGPVTDAQKEQFGRIRTSARHLLGLIDDILTLSRSEARDEVRASEVDVRQLVAETAGMVQPSAQAKHLELVVNTPAEPLVACTDAAKLRQILLNLLTNAIKYTEQGRVALTARAEGDRLVVEVWDTGIGIVPEHHEKIFDAFWQADQGTTRRVGGAGLGLAVARRLARLLGGDLNLESTPGKGSCFSVWVPLGLS